MKEKEKLRLKAAFYSLCRALNEQGIRWIPILCTLFTLISSIENLYALEYKVYTDMGDYFILKTPISDMFNRYYFVAFLFIPKLFWESITYLFCPYHQVFIYFLAINFVFEEYLKNRIFSDNYHTYFLIISILAALTILIALILHQIYGDRKMKQ